ncbi:MAG: hypothetical protein A2Y62_14325 [Candidatus Fischerbacteria bacterium RBG_13_37_8]|uniref:Glycosyltransferase RgtA/B/C/D-like domain-containing protein n=1 Tax=Candidatus Fischerbacteria bacterium RBG_13_37_8 TaxID=1817863 RepID=A0A1F5VNM1_9BACT|nr:MAG: hypothetical protein A2Y62_14325 [Candidatus Fischerbacteria bacterium RBG_13_37_8]
MKLRSTLIQYKNRPWLILCGLAVIILVLYGNAITNEFTFDDINNIMHNDYLRSANGIAQLAFSPVRPGEVLRGYLYRPFLAFIQYIIGSVFGFSPVPFHTANLIFYTLNCFLLFLFLKKLFNERIAIVATLIFTFHPIHTEVVASAVSITEMLAFLFSMFVLIAYLKSSASIKYLAIVSLGYFLALLSKETAILLPLVILLLAIYRNEPLRHYLHMGIWCGVPLLIYFMLRYHVIGSFLQSMETQIPFLNNPLSTMPFFERVINAVHILGRYLVLLFLPVQLSADYAYNSIHLLISASSMLFLISLLVHVILLGIAFVFLKKNTLLSFSIIIFYLGVLPSANLLFVSGTIMGERLIYLSSIGFATAMAGLYWYLHHTWNIHKNLLTACLVIILFLFGCKTIARNTDWENNYTLFKSAIQYYPDNAKANYNYAVLSYERGDAEACQRHAEKTLSIYPDYYKATMLLAQLEIDRGKYNAAERMLMEVPSMPDNIESLHLMRGFIYVQTNRFTKAIELYKSALEKIPHSFAIMYHLALCYFDFKDYANATQYLQQAIEIMDHPDAHYYLGQIYLIYFDYNNAAIHFAIAISSRQFGNMSILNLIYCKTQLGEYQQALKIIEESIARGVDEPDLYLLAAYSSLKMNNIPKSQYYFDKLRQSGIRSCTQLRFSSLCQQLIRGIRE